jgi:hypothetical protein
VGKIQRDIVKLQPLPGHAVLALVEGFLGAENEGGTSRLFRFGERGQPGSLFRRADSRPDFRRHAPDDFHIQTDGAELPALCDDSATHPGGVGDASDDGSRPLWPPVAVHAQRAVSKSELCQSPARAKPSGGELLNSFREGASEILRFVAKQQQRVAGYPQLGAHHARREQTGQKRRKTGRVFPARTALDDGRG